MRQLTVIEFVTLDGVMRGPGSPDEDRVGDFTRGGWGAPYGDHVQQEVAPEGMQTTTAYLFGRRTYEKMLSFRPQRPDADPMAAHLNAAPEYVATRTPEDAQPTWSNSRMLSGDLEAGVRALKAKAEGEGTVAALGSGVLVQQLAALDLVDGYRLFLHPLPLGTGKGLFGELDHPRPLRLLSAEPTSTGVVMLSYQCP